MHDAHAVAVEQRVELRAQRAEAARLDLDELAVRAHEVDDPAVDTHLGAVTGRAHQSLTEACSGPSRNTPMPVTVAERSDRHGCGSTDGGRAAAEGWTHRTRPRSPPCPPRRPEAPPRRADELLATLAERIGGRLSASLIYGDAVERDGVTVIPVASAKFMIGGGGGTDPRKEQEGAGGGGGGTVTPIGYIELRDGRSRYVPIVHPARMFGLVCCTLLAGVAIARLARPSR